MRRLARRALIILAGLAALAIIVPLIIPIPSLQGTVPPEQLADPDSLFIEAGGLRVHYKDQGTDEPALILLHGFLASTYSWREVMSPLSEFSRVVAFDRPAFGLTQRPLPGEWQGANPYSPEAQADLTIALMDRLGIERAVLVGHSAGGNIAALTALRHPQRVEALVLVDAAIYAGRTIRDWMHPLLMTPQLRRIGPLLTRSVVRWGEDFGRSAWYDHRGLTPEVWDGYTASLKVENWDRALWEYLLASRPRDLPPRLGEIQVPVLVITGGEDRIVPTEQSLRLAADLPDARVVLIEACGHVPQEECPQPFLEATIRFISELPASP